MHDFIHDVDQFDTSSEEGLEKKATRLMARRAELDGAGEDKFALVIWNGQDRLRKFPVASSQDVLDSHAALEKNADHLPDEIVKIARHHIEIAGREHLGRSLYGAVDRDVLTNVIYTDEIDRAAFDDKRSFVKESSAFTVGSQLSVSSADHVKEAENVFPMLGLRGREAYDAARTLIKAAEAYGHELSNPEVLRWGRDSLPQAFNEHVEYRSQMAPPNVKGLYDRFMKVAAERTITPIEAAECLHALDQLAAFAPIDAEKIANNRLGQSGLSAFEVVFPAEENVQVPDLTKVAEVFGEDFARVYDQDPSGVMAKLSKTERSLLEHLTA